MIESYGTIRFEFGHWRIECEPHVSSRIKRVFPRIKQEAAKYLELSATPENSRELAWFLTRYPMMVEEPQRLRDLAAKHVDTEMRLSDLMTRRVPPPDVELAIPARQYQLEVPQLLSIVEGLLLADDLGLGKTVSAIACMPLCRTLPTLVVCPTHLPRQWQAMIHRFAPHLTTHIVSKASVYPMVPRTAETLRKRNQPEGMPDVIICGYHKLKGWAESLAGNVGLVVFDECQQLRSGDSAIYSACNLIADRAMYRLGLSATPIYNYGSEFWNVINVLKPDALGSDSEFIREWCGGGTYEKARLKDAKEFGGFLRREGIMLRRTREEVGRELPELTKVVHEVDSNVAVLDEMLTDAAALAKTVLRANEQYRGEKMQASGVFDAMMRQATGLAKASYVAQFVDMLLDTGEPVVLFGWHHAVYSIWQQQLAAHKPVFYGGAQSEAQKAEALRAFTAGETRLLIMSLRSGAGVDGLQGHANIVVFGELDWSPGVHEQCIGRVHRDGQDAACTAYFLVSDAGADPIMVEVLGVKRDQIEGVRNPDSALVERVDTGTNNIRRLAREFLERRGTTVDDEENVVDLRGREREA